MGISLPLVPLLIQMGQNEIHVVPVDLCNVIRCQMPADGFLNAQAGSESCRYLTDVLSDLCVHVEDAFRFRPVLFSVLE